MTLYFNCSSTNIYMYMSMILPLKPLYIYQNERLMQYKSDMTQINNPRFSRPFPCQLIENGSLKQPIYCSI